MDFTCRKYNELLRALQNTGYAFRTFESFCQGDQEGRFVILRHDIDARPSHACRFAKIEHALDVQATYYFRIVRESNNPEAIQFIASLGHEIGYHYEDLTLAKGDPAKAIELFAEHLHYFQQFYPIKTISMHGSPTSPYDNRDIWKTFDYHTWGIIGEPYFDVDFQHVAYLTDTGRRWNDTKSNRRDKVVSPYRFNLKTTDEIIHAIKLEQLPDKVMITTHPQRWNDNTLKWLQELVMQQIKNKIKHYFFT
jgi:hypothetical protein